VHALAYPRIQAAANEYIGKGYWRKRGEVILMLAKKLETDLEDESCYASELPAGMNYPDDDPYILELKRRNPDALWDRYVPSEVIVERMKTFYETLWAEDAETARSFPEFDMPAGLWEYNQMWEFEWQEEPEKVKENFRKPSRPDE
jgi:hypothetical protein